LGPKKIEKQDCPRNQADEQAAEKKSKPAKFRTDDHARFRDKKNSTSHNITILATRYFEVR
jgi:hypothetical protein